MNSKLSQCPIGAIPDDPASNPPPCGEAGARFEWGAKRSTSVGPSQVAGELLKRLGASLVQPLSGVVGG
ncbi:hypothetical protein NOVOSPHI9U_400004 [Novosphingobium sp. 9U]|nr:hypothetical protein NOVOSPHI9U_400004 [Novosphingobium sp. 9U]